MNFKYSLEDIKSAAQFVIDNISNTNIVLFEGEMGVGKTTLIKEICGIKGVVDSINSPTFSIVNEYQTNKNNTIYHFDFYRINDVEEAINIGAEEYFFSKNLCLIEWAGMVQEILPNEYILVSLAIEEDNSRLISISYER